MELFLVLVGSVIVITAGILVFPLVIYLFVRVYKLEQMIKKGGVQQVSESSSNQPQQPVVQQPEILGSLVSYIRERLNEGGDIAQIKDLLISRGWQAADVEKAISLVGLPAQPSQPVTTPTQTAPMLLDKFIEWIKEDWLMKLGALLLLIGFGWFTTYAFLNNWIGPMGRISLGIFCGALFILLGWWRIGKYLQQGGVFLVLGSTTILLTVYAAREIYDFFTPLSALVVMFLSTVFVALASVKYNNRSLALVSLLFAGIAPLLTSSSAEDYIGLFAYLLVVVLGTIWVVVLTGRRELTTAALLLIVLYSAPHLLSLTYVDRDILLLFAYAFAAIFFLTNTVGFLKLKDKNIVPDLVTAAGNGLFLLAWIMTSVQAEWQSLIISMWMIIFTVGAFLVFRITHRREPFYVYAGVGVAMLAAATSAELKGATLTIAYTIECAIIALVAYLVLRDIKIAERTCLLFGAPVFLSVQSIFSEAWLMGVFHEDFFVLLVLGLTLLGLGWYFSDYVREAKEEEAQLLNTTLLVVGSAYIYILLWRSLHAWLQDDLAIMISLAVYTIIGIIAYFYGLIGKKNGLRLYGGVLVGLVVGRLLFVDVWAMELTGRIITFFLVGSLLAATAFLGKKKAGQNISNNI